MFYLFLNYLLANERHFSFILPCFETWSAAYLCPFDWPSPRFFFWYWTIVLCSSEYVNRVPVPLLVRALAKKKETRMRAL